MCRWGTSGGPTHIPASRSGTPWELELRQVTSAESDFMATRRTSYCIKMGMVQQYLCSLEQVAHLAHGPSMCKIGMNPAPSLAACQQMWLLAMSHTSCQLACRWPIGHPILLIPGSSLEAGGTRGYGDTFYLDNPLSSDLSWLVSALSNGTAV